MKVARKIDRDSFICLGLLLAVVVAYARVLGYGFVSIDDDMYVYANAMVRDGFLASSLRFAFSFTQHNWHPLTWLSLQFDAQIFGLRPEYFHLTNVCLHLASVLLLFAALRAMSGKPWPSALAAALFAVHPLNVESVAWISERKNVLSTFCWMLGMHAYIRYAQRPSLRRYYGVAGGLVLGLMAKAAVMTMPVALLVLDFWPLRRLALFGSRDGRAHQVPVRRLLLEKVPLLVLAAGGAVLAMDAIAATGGRVTGVPLTLRVGQALVAAATYLGQLVWPAGLAVFYPYPRSLPGWEVVGAALLLVALTSVALGTARNRPYVLAGWLWFLVTLGPMYGLMQSGNWPAHADRYAYLPQIGVFMAVSFWLWDIVGEDRRKLAFAAAGCMVALVLLAAGTIRQSGYWENSRVLYTRALSVTEGNWLVHSQFGSVLMGVHDYAAAEVQLKAAMEENPLYTLAKYNLGILYSRTGQCGKAVPLFREILLDAPGSFKARYNLAVCLDSLGNSDVAMDEFKFLLEHHPQYLPTLVGLGRLFWRQGNLDLAERYFGVALSLQPGYELARRNAEALRRKPGGGPPPELVNQDAMSASTGQNPAP